MTCGNCIHRKVCFRALSSWGEVLGCPEHNMLEEHDLDKITKMIELKVAEEFKEKGENVYFELINLQRENELLMHHINDFTYRYNFKALFGEIDEISYKNSFNDVCISEENYNKLKEKYLNRKKEEI